ncbi:DegT/DnrJ/EryC1/StrS family aminotransferase [Actinopolymorpha cephalotaxi]|uniref:UDP-4-amino-4-deoxy-L-arabinose-oxoglutarate aminotransferase n=1 Tax=Actinopolymorpha cephalotaxi TaxID=504797 RepID=A0ABX2S3P6_9ACTN|nr:DegT/DnrJ/EryC1/StrS family aminotransferase [Actinopolymorpha cephalotaxi]NYH82977.1 UDP-4-amino-4-deoxy-L-arabinose-oxoglutarate aminotransferase [Actinopolymorpha cephalotaxi]
MEFYRHSLGADEKDAVARVLDSLFLTTGEEVYAFEREFAEYLGAPEVVALASCTAAEHLALLALGLRPGDEVITTPLTFVATATAILHAGGVPVFVDVEPSTGNLDPERVEAAITRRTRAIVPVHLYGTMCDMVALRELADRFGLVLVEDAAHCVEGERDGVRPAGLGDAACFSFYATKTLTSGEGGAVALRDAAVADRLRTLRLHGMTKNAADRYHGLYQHWDMTELGWKFNMSNIQGAMLRPQLGRLNDRLLRREEIARKYDAAIDQLDGVERPVVPAATRPARHLYTVWVEPDRRDTYLGYLGRNGVGTAVNYRAIHTLRWLRENVKVEHDLSNAESIGARTLSLPLYDGLRDDEVSRVCDVLAAAAREA